MRTYRQNESTEAVDALFAALASPVRRKLLQFIYEHEGAATLEDALDAVAADLDYQRTQLETAIVHVHLPKLQVAQLVETDESDRHVTLTDSQFVAPAVQLLERYQ